MSTTWIIDKSALVRLGASPDADMWANRIERGLVHITAITLLEVGYSARSGTDLDALLRTAPISAMPVEYSAPAMEDRAIEVLQRLAERGQHRAPSIPDLLLAATAEISNRSVLHVDKGFELIAGLTGQPVERLRLWSNRRMSPPVDPDLWSATRSVCASSESEQPATLSTSAHELRETPATRRNAIAIAADRD